MLVSNCCHVPRDYENHIAGFREDNYFLCSLAASGAFAVFWVPDKVSSFNIDMLDLI